MNSQASDEKPHELILVRRRGGDHDHGHGGSVWKIAYADFMTAMMAFFLVMWLINASDKETLTAVASYFDPIRLTDKIANPRGLHDMDSGARGNEDRPGESTLKNGTSKGDPRAEVGPKAKYPEDVLFSDPYGILAKLAALATVEKAVEAQGQADAVNVAGEAFRDPFDPEFKSPSDQAIAEIMRSQAEAQQLERAAEAQQLAIAEEAQGERSTGAGAGVAADANVGVSASDAVARTSSESSDQDRIGKAESPPAPVVDPGLEAQIKYALRQSAPGSMPHVEVRGTSEGILISLTDEFDFGMFAISSAEPRPETVVLMERIAKILVERPEQIVVRGHTDGRPFKSQTYDNWRLSSARAHMAYYMLVRGGIEEKRFERIEGHADRNLKVAGEPEAAQNRRIEILLRRGHAS